MAEELGPREWSPRTGRGRGQVFIKVIANLGDRHPFDYGGFIVYRVHDPSKKEGPDRDWIQAEYWDEPLDTGDPMLDRYDVYVFQIDPDVIEDLNWVDDWNRIAETFGMSEDEIRKMAKGSVTERAAAYEMVGRHHGFDNLDSYPFHLTRKEMEERWPEFK